MPGAYAAQAMNQDWLALMDSCMEDWWGSCRKRELLGQGWVKRNGHMQKMDDCMFFLKGSFWTHMPSRKCRKAEHKDKVQRKEVIGTGCCNRPKVSGALLSRVYTNICSICIALTQLWMVKLASEAYLQCCFCR